MTGAEIDKVSTALGAPLTPTLIAPSLQLFPCGTISNVQSFNNTWACSAVLVCWAAGCRLLPIGFRRSRNLIMARLKKIVPWQSTMVKTGRKEHSVQLCESELGVGLVGEATRSRRLIRETST